MDGLYKRGSLQLPSLELCPCFLVLEAELKTLAEERLIVMDAVYVLQA